MKGNYNAKFLEAIDFAFKKSHFTSVPKAEQLQTIHAVVTDNDGFVKPATGFGKSVLGTRSFILAICLCLIVQFSHRMAKDLSKQ